MGRLRFPALIALLAFGICALFLSGATSLAQSSACDEWVYHQWTDQQVSDCLETLEGTEDNKTYVWELAALNGLGLDMAAHHARNGSPQLHEDARDWLVLIDSRLAEIQRVVPAVALQMLYTEWARHHFAELGE